MASGYNAFNDYYDWMQGQTNAYADNQDAYKELTKLNNDYMGLQSSGNANDWSADRLRSQYSGNFTQNSGQNWDPITNTTKKFTSTNPNNYNYTQPWLSKSQQELDALNARRFNNTYSNTNNIDKWIADQKLAYTQQYNDIINKYPNAGTQDETPAATTDTNNTNEYGLNVGNTDAGTGTGNVSNPSDTGGNTVSQPQSGLANYVSSTDAILRNPDQPGEAALYGLLADNQTMLQNNQQMIADEKARADALLEQLKQQSGNIQQTESYEDILKRNTDPSSPIMQQAIRQAREEMNARGLLNSSMGASATSDAVLKRAMEIAAGETQSQQFNAGQYNTMQNNLLGEMGATGRQSMGFMGDIYKSNQDYNEGLLGERQSFGLDLIANKQKTNDKITELEAAHAMDMDKTMMEFVQGRATEMLSQQTSLFNNYLQAYADISQSEIPESAKSAHLAALGGEINRAVTAANQYSQLRVTADEINGGYKFNPVYNSKSVINNTDTTGKSALYTPETVGAGINELTMKMNEIYSKVRVGGGDTPQEALIDGWRRAYALAPKDDATLVKMANIYAENGLYNDNWETVVQSMTDTLVKATGERMNEIHEQYKNLSLAELTELNTSELDELERRYVMDRILTENSGG